MGILGNVFNNLSVNLKLSQSKMLNRDRQQYLMALMTEVHNTAYEVILHALSPTPQKNTWI